MLAAVLSGNFAKAVVAEALELGLVVNAVRENVIRMTPPLVISEQEITDGISILEKAIKKHAPLP